MDFPDNLGERYFFMGKKCYKLEKIKKRDNVVIAKDLQTFKRVSFDYFQWKSNHKKGYTVPEMLKIFNRSKYVFYTWIKDGHISVPFHYNKLDPDEKDTSKTLKVAIGRDQKGFILNEENLYQIRNYLEQHSTRKKDIPSVPELKRLLNNNLVYWVKTPSGEFVPTFRA